MPYNEALAARIEKFFSARRVAFESKRMMGGLVFMVNGKMCVGVEQTRLMARIDPAEQTAALARKGCRPMDFTGRPMRGFVFVTTEVLRTDAQLESWLTLALAFNPKAVASKRAKARALPRSR
jgi:TfoX/Sxy family transcriptional regulator of competence genes